MTKANYWIDTVIPAFIETGVDPVLAGALLENAETLGNMCPYAIHFRQAICTKLAKSKIADDKTTKVFLDMFEVGFTMGIMAGVSAQYQETQEIFKGASTKDKLKMVISGDII